MANPSVSPRATPATWGDAAASWGSAEVSWTGGIPVVVAEPTESVQYVSYAGEWVPLALTPAVPDEGRAEFDAGTPTKAVFTLYNADGSPAANASARLELAYPTFTEWQDVASDAGGQAVYDAATWAGGMPHYIRLHSIDGTIVTPWHGPLGPQDPTVSIASMAELKGYVRAGPSGDFVSASTTAGTYIDFSTDSDTGGLNYYYYGMGPDSVLPPPPALAPGWSGDVVQILRNAAAGDTLTALYYGYTSPVGVGTVITWTTVQSWSAPDSAAFDGAEIYIIGTPTAPTVDLYYMIQSVPFGTLPPNGSKTAAELAWGFQNLVFTPPA